MEAKGRCEALATRQLERRDVRKNDVNRVCRCDARCLRGERSGAVANGGFTRGGMFTWR